MGLFDIATIRFWIDIFWLVWGVGTTAFVFIDRRNKVTQEAIVKLRTEVSQEVSTLRSDLDIRRRRVDETIEIMRSRLADTPTRIDLTRLNEVVSDVARVSNELRGTVHALQNTMQLINQHLMGGQHG